MSSIARKIRKNAENFIIQDVYKNMTPEQYQKGIERAINLTKQELNKDFQYQYEKLCNKFNREMHIQAGQIIDTISVELIYELANQMHAFDEEDEEIRNQIIEKVQEIYENTMSSIKKYSSYKNDWQASKEFEKRKKKIEKYFKFKF
jgi:glutamine synthetase type III